MRKYQTALFYATIILTSLIWLQICWNTIIGALFGVVLGGLNKFNTSDLLVLMPWAALLGFPTFAIAMRKRNKHTFAWVSVALSVICLASIFTSLSAISPYAPVRKEGGKYVYITHIGKNEYHIPRVYTARLENDVKSLLINATLPDMTEPQPIPVGSPDVLRAIVENNIFTLVTYTAGAPTFDYILNLTKQRLFLKPNGHKFGLDAYLSSRGELGEVISPESPVYVGLDLVKNPTPEQKLGLLEEFFTDSENNPTTYITCNGDYAVASLGCTEVFVDNDLRYEINFRKSHLKEWSTIKASAIKQMQGFRTPQN